MGDLKSWLVEESYAVVGDLAETLSLLSEPYCSHKRASFSLAELCEKILPLLAKQTGEEKKQWFIQEVLPLEARQRFVLIKVMTGGFRVGLSRQGVTKALALWQEVTEQEMTFRLSGSLKNPPTVLNEILRGQQTQGQHSQPYPFYLASPFDPKNIGLSPPDTWRAEWKWDGIRGQLVKRQGEAFLWSRGEDLITMAFPGSFAKPISPARRDGSRWRGFST